MALNRFVSKLVNKCLPVFKILRKNKAFEWLDESKVAFQQLKEYLGLPLLLKVFNLGKELILYIFMSPTAVSVVLIKEEEKVHLIGLL